MIQSININSDTGTYHTGYKDAEVELNGQVLKRIRSCSDTPTGVLGTCAQIFLTNEYVIKVEPRRGEGTLFIKEEDRKHFAETILVGIDKKWIVQKRVNCLPNVNVTPEQCKLVRSLVKKYALRDVEEYNSTDLQGDTVLRGHNFTVDVNNDPIIFDYGFHDQPCELLGD